MTTLTLTAPHPQDRALTSEVLTHLEAQLASARSLLVLVLDQGSAIRARDVQTVVRLAGMLHGEMSRRETLEEQRSQLLTRSGERLGVAAQDVTLELLCTLMAPAQAERANALSAELRGLLHELGREHASNRTLMQIELGFLDHLMGVLALDNAGAYNTQGSSTSITRSRPGGGLHILDLRA